MMESGRLKRFADWDSVQQLSLSGRTDGLRPFFAGQHANDRMDAVRRAINDIRVNWDQYPRFMRELRDFMAEPASSGERADRYHGQLQTLLSSTKEWLGPEQATAQHDYSAIDLYTSDYGYRKMFGVINRAFRSAQLEGDPLTLRCATFLVELLTIDLFNYRTANPDADNFAGHVYRGMCVTAAELDMFARVARGPISERYLAIPLAMTSASRDKESALAFAREECARRPGSQPLLWDIEVSGLDRELLASYLDRFPETVVTSLCAVPVDQLSDYRDEQEVVLRGPHFQILRLASEDGVETRSGLPHIIDAIMLNTNRDHITAIASNVGSDRRSRDLFRAIVLIQRSMICAQRAERYDLLADADAYHEMARQNRELFHALL